MKVKFMVVSILVFTFLVIGILNAESIPGGSSMNDDIRMQNSLNNFDANNKFVTVSGDSTYNTTTYTSADIVVFSYFDSTEYSLYDNLGDKIDSVKLGMNSYYVFSPDSGAGVYSIKGTKSFTLLIGDPVSRSVMGYFAVDESGRPLSTNLNTFMPSYNHPGEHFIVFGYSPNTSFQITNISTGSIVATGILDEGEHYQLDGYNNTFINVTSNKPVSALSYADQGYFIPSTNGTFAGNKFYGFSGYVGGWGNGIIITAYNDSTTYLITNSESATNDTIAYGTLNAGEVYSQAIYTDTYWKVTTSKNSTVCNTPYAAYSSGYYYLTRQMDESGFGIGTNFYTPVIAGDYNMFSYEDNNVVTVFNQTDSLLVWSDTLDAGEYHSLYTSKKVYHVSSDENMSIISYNGGSYGADFMPLSFTTGLPDLAISEEHIIFTPDTIENEGDSIRIDATVYNYGYQTAYNVECQFFDGDPSGGDLISTLLVTDSISAGGNYTFSVDWIAPSNIKYHAVNVLVDPYDKIRESNSSNNLMFKYLVQNDDLLPPFTTSIEAPKSIHAYYGDLDTSQFEITVYMFNTGNISATNSFANIFLPEGLSLVDTADTSVAIGTILAQQNSSHTWQVHIDSIGDKDVFFYSVTVGADSIADKTLERMITINNFTSVKNEYNLIPDDFSLSQNYPNPFNPVTNFQYSIPKDTWVKISVFNVIGQKVAVLVDSYKNVGNYQMSFNANDLSSGIYYLRMQTNEFHSIRKMVYLK
ncbi:MAG: CARDB domain-containing protein [Candidatus Marinimicrobia bacterium]|nr:CARDB domain-containing protein [Candidatus Neomarinimicrobiota bacterium]